MSPSTTTSIPTMITIATLLPSAPAWLRIEQSEPVADTVDGTLARSSDSRTIPVYLSSPAS
jgi:hypothetical protein